MLKRKKNIRKIYLTFIGFSKVVNSTKIYRSFDIILIHNWLLQFNVTKYISEYIIVPSNTTIYGYTYCVSSPMINGAKIGYWNGSINSLKSRYVTYYGKNIELHTFPMRNPHKIEKKFIKKFAKYRISGELFDKKYVFKYIIFFNSCV